MSLTINKNTSNKLCFTAFEKGVLVNPYYLFEFIKDDNDSIPFFWVGTDTSAYKTRYNLCVFTEPGNLNLPVGFYKYNVYEQMSPSNLDPSGLLIVDFGILRVTDLTATMGVEYNQAEVTEVSYSG